MAGSYLLFFFAFTPIPLLANFGKLSDVSYGIYLYGRPMQQLKNLIFSGISPWMLFVASAVTAIGAGWAGWHLIEKHFIRSKRHLTVPAQYGPAGSIMARD